VPLKSFWLLNVVNIPNSCLPHTSSISNYRTRLVLTLLLSSTTCCGLH